MKSLASILLICPLCGDQKLIPRHEGHGDSLFMLQPCNKCDGDKEMKDTELSFLQAFMDESINLLLIESCESESEKKLIEKYIIHVRQCEGIDFIDRINNKMDSDVEFTEREKRVLEKFHKEI